MSSRDERSLRQKLVDLANDPGAAPMERQGVRAKIAKIDVQTARDKKFAAKHGYDFIPAADPMRPNAGWQAKNRHESDSGELRKRDYKTSPRYQRGINRDAWINLQNQARARVKYENEYLLGLFGKTAGDVTTAEQNRARLKQFVGSEIYIIDNICLINGKITKRLLFWTHGTQVRMYWFIVERDTITGRTQRSKRYFSRDGALLAHTSDQITWQRCEYT